MQRSEEQTSPVNNNTCFPEYICEEMCKVLIQLYKKLSTDSPKTDLSQGDYFTIYILRINNNILYIIIL